MTSILEAPELIEYVETHDLTIERPRARGAHPGLWRTVMQYVTRHSTRTRHRTPSASCVSRHQMEAPADLLARQYPTLYIQAYAGQ